MGDRQMIAAYNPKTTEHSATMLVFVHEKFHQYGEEWAVVNKGKVKTKMTFKVRVKALEEA
jgi:hypothetical protein